MLAPDKGFWSEWMSINRIHAGRWRAHLKHLASSGMSRDAYCAWHGVSRSTLYRWERRLRTHSSFAPLEWIAIERPDGAWLLPLRSPSGC